METCKLALSSFGRYVRLALHGKLHLNHSRLGKLYTVDSSGPYKVFRDTVCNGYVTNEPVVLIVWFRLKFIRSNPVLHWLFQRVCILTTPFWSGFAGFAIKLWMVNPKTKSYLGIYKWNGRANAQKYATTLLRVLKPICTPNSVKYKIIQDISFKNYLKSQKVQ